MSDRCENCTEIQKLKFQIKGLELLEHKNELSIEAVHDMQDVRDTEHEQMIQNVTTRMDIMSSDLVEFKKEVKADIKEVKDKMTEEIQSVKADIPKLFEASINKLLAKIAKYLLYGILIIIAVIVLAFSKPLILKGIDGVRHWVETVEVKK